MAQNTEFHAAQPKLSYDIVPGRTLQDVIDSIHRERRRLRVAARLRVPARRAGKRRISRH